MKQATIHFDGGGQSLGPVTAACTVELSDGSFDEDVKRFDQGTHNTAEWHALILGLRMALKHGERHVLVKGDSMLVVRQINREWKTRNAALQSLRAQAEELLALFETWRVQFRDQLRGALARADGPTRAVVLDAIGMSDLDYTGSRSLRDVLDSLDRKHISFAIARAGEHVRNGLARSGLLERIGEDRLFPSVGEAVTALRQEDSGSLSKPSGHPGPIDT